METMKCVVKERNRLTDWKQQKRKKMQRGKGLNVSKKERKIIETLGGKKERKKKWREKKEVKRKKERKKEKKKERKKAICLMEWSERNKKKKIKNDWLDRKKSGWYVIEWDR